MNNRHRQHTWSDLDLYRKDDELVLIGGVGFDSNVGCVVVHISGREACSHHPFCLKRRNLLEEEEQYMWQSLNVMSITAHFQIKKKNN